MLDRKLSRRVARIYEKLELGTVGHPSECYRTVELTTREGVRNDMATFAKDFRQLRLELKKAGIDFEYVLERGVSPNKGLVHSHALFRMLRNDTWGYDIPYGCLCVLWQGIHGASITHFDKPLSMHKVHKYIASHMLKAMQEANGRLMVSRRWLPEGWRPVRKALTKWVLSTPMIEWSKNFIEMRGFMKKWVQGYVLTVTLNGRELVYRRDLDGASS